MAGWSPARSAASSSIEAPSTARCAASARAACLPPARSRRLLLPPRGLLSISEKLAKGGELAGLSRMKFVAANLLAVLAGNNDPSVEDLKTILESVGAEIDTEKMEHPLSQVSGKDITDLTELIAAGREKFASVPCGGGGDMGFNLFDQVL